MTGARTAFVVAGLVLAAAPSAALSSPADQIFTAARQSELCTVVANGQRYVDRGDLALAMLTEAAVPYNLVNASVSPESLKEQAIGIVTQETPFADRTGVEAVRARIDLVLSSLGIFLQKDSAGNAYYEVRSPAGTPSALLVPDDFFGTNGAEQTVDIACVPPPSDSAGRKAPSPPEIAAHLAEALRVRGKLDHLHLSGKKATAAAPAQVAFTDNLAAESKTAQFDAVVGLAFETGSENVLASLIPFVEYHRKKTTKKNAPSSRIETLGLGVMFNSLVDMDAVVWEISLTPQMIFDEAQDTEFLRLSGFVDPSFAIGPDIVVGGYNILFGGNVWIKPDISGIVEAGTVTAGGRSPILTEGDEFYGAGAEASLHLFLPNLPLLRNLVLGASYRYVELFSLPIDHADRWIFDAEYALDKDRHFVVKLAFENGRNEVTYQNEKFWQVSMGVRF